LIDEKELLIEENEAVKKKIVEVVTERDGLITQIENLSRQIPTTAKSKDSIILDLMISLSDEGSFSMENIKHLRI
jgi:hypothetical protein